MFLKNQNILKISIKTIESNLKKLLRIIKFTEVTSLSQAYNLMLGL